MRTQLVAMIAVVCISAFAGCNGNEQTDAARPRATSAKAARPSAKKTYAPQALPIRANSADHNGRENTGRKPWELTARSSNGTYRFEGNGLIDYHYYFMSGSVTYALYEEGSTDPIWRHAFPDQIFPGDVFVHDKGWLVTRDAHRLTVFAPTGEEVFQQYLQEDVIPLQDLKKFARWRHHALGYLWSGRSHWFFVDVDETPYFCIRTWWGRRVAIDLPAAAVVELDTPLRAAADTEEKRLVLDVLQEAAAVTFSDKPLSDKDEQKLWRAADAAHLAGCIKLNEAIPLLEKLEPVDLPTSWFMMKLEFPDGRLPFSYGTYELRQMVQLALRRLGEKPAGYAPTSFEVRKGDTKRKVFESTATFPDRDRSVGRLQKQMKPIEVLNTVGPPDYVDSSKSAWQYDIDCANPYTLSVVWEERRVAEIKKQSPPLWKVGHTRDRP